MRSSEQFIEITGDNNGKKFLLNKSAIIFVTQSEIEDKAIIIMQDGDRLHKIPSKETYASISEELLWWSSEIREDDDD